MINLKEKTKKKQAAEKDYYSSVLLSQIFCCTIAVALFFVLKSGGNGDTLLKAYAALLSDDFITGEVDTVVAEFGDYLFDNDSAFAVNGSAVEPYVTSQAQVSTTAEAEAEPVFSAVSEISYKTDKPKAENTGLTVKREPSFVFPVEGGRYTSFFGERTDPISEGSDYHNGIDIGADEGDEIRAFSGGIVTETGEDSRSGKYLFISHGNGYETFYCHCSEILVSEGTVINKGETVALVGSTGYSTGPHLHFEIRLNGESTDPLPFLENAA